MLSKAAEYAVRACLWLAEHPGRAWTAHQIADAIQAPANYLAKVLQTLRRAEFVLAQPGPGGGFALGRAPEELCVLDLIRAIDRPHRARAGVHAPGAAAESAVTRLDQTFAQIEDSFRRCTLAALLQESSKIKSPTSTEGRAP